MAAPDLIQQPRARALLLGALQQFETADGAYSPLGAAQPFSDDRLALSAADRGLPVAVPDRATGMSVPTSPDPIPGTPAGAFLAMNLHQDLGLDIIRPGRLIRSLAQCRRPSACYVSPGTTDAEGTLHTTVAAILTWRQVAGGWDSDAVDWLSEQQTHAGGFLASPTASLPDLLSTGVALFALAVFLRPMEGLRGPALAFINDHWLPSGAFSATLEDDEGDLEYVFYALLAMGALYVHR